MTNEQSFIEQYIKNLTKADFEGVELSFHEVETLSGKITEKIKTNVMLPDATEPLTLFVEGGVITSHGQLKRLAEARFSILPSNTFPEFVTDIKIHQNACGACKNLARDAAIFEHLAMSMFSWGGISAIQDEADRKKRETNPALLSNAFREGYKYSLSKREQAESEIRKALGSIMQNIADKVTPQAPKDVN